MRQKLADQAYQLMIRSYADELLRRGGPKRVHMELIEHDFPSPDEFLKGLRLDDPSLYRKIGRSGHVSGAEAMSLRRRLFSRTCPIDAATAGIAFGLRPLTRRHSA